MCYGLCDAHVQVSPLWTRVGGQVLPAMEAEWCFAASETSTRPSQAWFVSVFRFLPKQLLSKRTQRRKWEAGRQRKVLHSKQQPVGPPDAA